MVLLIFALVGCASTKKEESSDTSAVESVSASKPEGPTLESKPVEADPLALMTCVNGQETRTMAIATKEGGCELHYEKYGKDRVISRSSYNVTTCLNSRKKLHDELVKAGWRCQQ